MWTKNNTEQQLIEGVLKHGPDILEHCETSDELTQYINRINQERLDYPLPTKQVDPTQWFIPNEYCPNLVEMLYSMCKTKEQSERVSLELELFVKNDMYNVLHVMKYIVDTLRENNIVWGVGRGSSVASYVLYLIGVHKVDSIKYNLPIEEFFKGEQNG
jgi:DNA polymerase III alpha subunit